MVINPLCTGARFVCEPVYLCETVVLFFKLEVLATQDFSLRIHVHGKA